MPEFHLTLTPGILTQPDQVIRIAFDDPEDADNVEVTLWELDRWAGDSEEIREAGPDDLIATFRGELVDGVFQGEIGRRGRARRNAPVIKVQFDGGGQVHELPVPSNGNEHEGGVLEIAASVRGRIDGERKTYRTPHPVFVRQFRNGRPVVSFITGRGGYFTAARRYWNTHGDGVFDRASVEETLAFVRTAPTERGYGCWGEVNVCSHGNAWEWVLWLFRQQRGVENINHIKRSDLHARAGDPRLLPAPQAAQLDASSRIVLRGCVLGRNQTLLDEIRRLFGGAATLYAPKYIQYYWASADTSREAFHEQFFFYRRGTRAPRENDCINELAQKYPGVMSDAEWRTLLRNKIVSRETFSVPMRFTEWDHRLTRDEARSELPASFDANDFESRMGTTLEDWEWPPPAIDHQRGTTTYRARFVGRRVRVEVRRPLLDSEGHPVVPDLNNPDHYGRSPQR